MHWLPKWGDLEKEVVNTPEKNNSEVAVVHGVLIVHRRYVDILYSLLLLSPATIKSRSRWQPPFIP